MKHLAKLAFFMASLLLSASSCTESEDSCKVPKNESSTLQSLLNDFSSSLCKNSRATETTPVIESVSKRYYVIRNGKVEETSVPTRSNNAISDSTFSISTVTLRKGTTEGYALLSDDPGINKVLVYCEDGSLADTAYIPPLKLVVDSIHYIGALNWRSDNSATNSSQDEEIIGPLLNTKWDQESPYNMYMPSCSCSDCSKRGGHQYVGCVPLATAQYIAKCGKFNGTFYGNRNPDFAEMTKQPYSNATTISSITQFIHEVALNCQTKFGCQASSSQPKAAYHYLLDMGYNCSYDEKAVDIARIEAELRKGFPHLIGAGVKNKKSAHMWVIDGLKYTADKTCYLHHNWGHTKGSSNCWILSTYFVESEGLTYEGKWQQIYTNSL